MVVPIAYRASPIATTTARILRTSDTQVGVGTARLEQRDADDRPRSPRPPRGCGSIPIATPPSTRPPARPRTGPAGRAPGRPRPAIAVIVSDDHARRPGRMAAAAAIRRQVHRCTRSRGHAASPRRLAVLIDGRREAGQCGAQLREFRADLRRGSAEARGVRDASQRRLQVVERRLHLIDGRLEFGGDRRHRGVQIRLAPRVAADFSASRPSLTGLTSVSAVTESLSAAASAQPAGPPTSSSPPPPSSLLQPAAATSRTTRNEWRAPRQRPPDRSTVTDLGVEASSRHGQVSLLPPSAAWPARRRPHRSPSR